MLLEPMVPPTSQFWRHFDENFKVTGIMLECSSSDCFSSDHIVHIAKLMSVKLHSKS